MARQVGDGVNVLIETLWNVKKPRLMDWEQDGDSINRNIVECKETGKGKKKET